MRSEEEIWASLEKNMLDGVRDGSIHSSPPNPNYLADLLPDETASAEEPSAATSTTENSAIVSQPAPPSKEQLRNLVSDFLDQLIASIPPAKNSEEQ